MSGKRDEDEGGKEDEPPPKEGVNEAKFYLFLQSETYFCWGGKGLKTLYIERIGNVLLVC